MHGPHRQLSPLRLTRHRASTQISGHDNEMRRRVPKLAAISMTIETVSYNRSLTELLAHSAGARAGVYKRLNQQLRERQPHGRRCARRATGRWMRRYELDGRRRRSQTTWSCAPLPCAREAAERDGVPVRRIYGVADLDAGELACSGSVRPFRGAVRLPEHRASRMGIRHRALRREMAERTRLLLKVHQSTDCLLALTKNTATSRPESAQRAACST